MRPVSHADPRFTVGLAAMRVVDPPYVSRRRRGVTEYAKQCFTPGEVVLPFGSRGVEAMVLAEQHLAFEGAHQWVTIPQMFRAIGADDTPGMPLVFGFAIVGVAELYVTIPYPEPRRSYLRATDYVFAVLDWEKVFARDTAIRLGAKELAGAIIG